MEEKRREQQAVRKRLGSPGGGRRDREGQPGSDKPGRADGGTGSDIGRDGREESREEHG